MQFMSFFDSDKSVKGAPIPVEIRGVPILDFRQVSVIPYNGKYYYVFGGVALIRVAGFTENGVHAKEIIKQFHDLMSKAEDPYHRSTSSYMATCRSMRETFVKYTAWSKKHE